LQKQTYQRKKVLCSGSLFSILHSQFSIKSAINPKYRKFCGVVKGCRGRPACLPILWRCFTLFTGYFATKFAPLPQCLPPCLNHDLPDYRKNVHLQMLYQVCGYTYLKDFRDFSTITAFFSIFLLWIPLTYSFRFSCLCCWQWRFPLE
jgi:hypothetical protein